VYGCAFIHTRNSSAADRASAIAAQPGDATGIPRELPACDGPRVDRLSFLPLAPFRTVASPGFPPSRDSSESASAAIGRVMNVCLAIIAAAPHN